MNRLSQLPPRRSAQRTALEKAPCRLTAVILAQAGVGFTVEDEAKRVVCDGLVRTGHLAPIAGVPNGYTVGDQIAKGMIANTVQKSEQAKDN